MKAHFWYLYFRNFRTNIGFPFSNIFAAYTFVPKIWDFHGILFPQLLFIWIILNSHIKEWVL
jgi:hypothetical protein